jgi:quercetin dioxygenase-like cupin family protein
MIVVTDGVIELERSDQEEISTHSKYDYIFLPKETVHQITVKKAPVKLVIIHPERQESH